jgi:AbrB family looped-hinge helix DNA binding protein
MNKDIKKKLEKDGRLYIPTSIRKELNINANDFVTIKVENNKIILEKASYKYCFNCNKESQLIRFKNSLICEECFARLVIK